MNANDIFENEEGQARYTKSNQRHGNIITISRKSHHKSDFYNTTRTIYSFLIHFDCIVQGNLCTHTHTHSILDGWWIKSYLIAFQDVYCHRIVNLFSFYLAWVWCRFGAKFSVKQESVFRINLCRKIFAHLILGDGVKFCHKHQSMCLLWRVACKLNT